MSRPLGIQYPDAVYHVMNRGTNRRPIFLTDQDRKTFLTLLAACWERWRVEIYAYCLMGNHYHLCLRTPEAKLDRVMRHLNGVYTQRFNRAHKRDGTLFRGRYKSLLIEAEEYLSQVIRYIHLNPIKAKICERPESYPWSSHAGYLNKKYRPKWLNTQLIGQRFAKARDFQAYVMSGNEIALEKLYGKKRLPAILGTEKFIEEIKEKPVALSKEHGRESLEFFRYSPEYLIKEVAKVFGKKPDDLKKGKSGNNNEARKVAMWLVKELCDLSHRKVASYFGSVGDKTIAWACGNIKQELENNRKLKKTVLPLVKKLKINDGYNHNN